MNKDDLGVGWKSVRMERKESDVETFLLTEKVLRNPQEEKDKLSTRLAIDFDSSSLKTIGAFDICPEYFCGIEY